MIRWVVAVIAGMLCACVVWIAAPVNLTILNNGLIADSFFPELAVAVMLVLLLIINPILKLISSKHLFIDERQMALIFAMLLLACTVPAQGLLRMLPYSLAKTTQNCSQNKLLAEIHQKMNLPPSLFPDKIEYGEDTPNSTYLLEELPKGESIPWKAWIPVLLSWGAFLTAVWAFMIGLAMIVYPQWRNNERLPFPLLTLEQELIGGITPERRIPSIFRDKLFWLGCGLVLFLYALNGISEFSGGKCPTFPLGWNLGRALSEEPWRNLNWSIKSVPKLYFAIIGISYFMPNRISFSIWVTVLIYGAYRMLGMTYAPPFDHAIIANHRHGSTFALGIIVLFLGRRHWLAVARSMFRKARTSEEGMNRAAGWIFTGGIIGMAAWLLWVGVEPAWTAALLFFGFLSTLVISRIVAETGLPFMRITAIQSHWIVLLLPAKLISAPALYMAGFLTMIFSMGSRVSPAAMATHAMGIDKKATPTYQKRTGLLLILLLMTGLVFSGAVHMKMSYNVSSSLDGQLLQNTAWGGSRMIASENQLLSWSRGAHRAVEAKDIRQVAGGAAIAAALLIACFTVPGWPLHPIGMLMVGHFYANTAWASILLGWLAKTLIIRYGGANIYRRMRTLFIGLILGEVFAAVIWALVPVFLVLSGADPTQMGHMQIVPG